MNLVFVLFVSTYLGITCVSTTQLGHPFKTVEHHSSHSGTSASGHNKNGKHNGEKNHAKETHANEEHNEDVARKGEKSKELHKVEDEQKGGKKHEHHSEDSHEKFDHSDGKSTHGAKFQEGAKRKKGNSKKGFREKYHKDEERSNGEFYSNAHKSGEYAVFGKKHAKTSSQSVTKKHLNNHKKSEATKENAKSGKKAGGHNQQENGGYRSQTGKKKHYNHAGRWATESFKKGGKNYHSAVPASKV